MQLEFEWDEEKAAMNVVKHGVSFLTAAAIFLNRYWNVSMTGKIMERLGSLHLEGSTQKFTG